MKMKKVMLMLLSAALLVSAAGCGSTGKDAADSAKEADGPSAKDEDTKDHYVVQ